MPRFQAFSDDSEVIGQNMLALIQNTRKEDIQPYLDKYGIATIDPDQWYPLQTWLNVLGDMYDAHPGQASSNFVSIGMEVAQTAVFPPEFDELSLQDIMLGWNDAYKLNNRGSDVGEMITEIVSDHHIKMVCRIPYPDDFNYGVFYGTARRFLPPGTDFTVSYDEDEPPREQGGNVTIYHIEWE